MIVYRSKFKEATGPRSLLAIKFNKGTLLEPQSGKFTIFSISALSAAKPDAFKRKNLEMDLGLIIQKKLREKCLLNYAWVTNHPSCLVLDEISSKKKAAISKFGKLFTAMCENQHFYAEEADKANDQFEFFIDSEGCKFSEELSAGEVRDDWLDVFF